MRRANTGRPRADAADVSVALLMVLMLERVEFAKG
jgi:hypothetical protein